MNISDAILDFINYCTFEKGLSRRTNESYTNDLEVYEKFLNSRGINLVSEVSDDDIKAF